MTITVTLPEDIVSRADPAREALEALAIEGYRTGALSPYQTRLLLGISTRNEFEGFLKEREVWEHSYDVEAYHQDLATIAKFGK